MKFSNETIPVRKENAPRIAVDPKSGKDVRHARIRDPFILPYDGRYYLYKGVYTDTLSACGVECLVSEDLVHWSDPIRVLIPPEGFHGEGDFFWAPECHYRNGRFYIFSSVRSRVYGGHRTVSAYRADNPLGPFEDIANGCLTPPDWDAIDGTLYLDKSGAPWLVFVHEWTCMPDKNGTMVAARLSDDLTKLISEPIFLFSSRDPAWANSNVTDGPFLYRMENGTLCMIWSNFTEKGYAIGVAKSESGEIDGKWTQEGVLYQKDLQPSFLRDGGHGMIFRAFSGETKIAFHSPNVPSAVPGEERLMIRTLVEKNGTIEIE